MCGICGELRFDGGPADPATIDRMNGAMAQRGPDGSGVWANGRVGLGHRRLAIIDLSRRGDQPMHDPELGLSLVFNGCIYNHRPLRAQLEAEGGYRFFSTSDSEVLLKAYHHWGDRFVDHLVGMFALCIVERDSGRAVLARDRLGIKPLYTAEVPGALRFASSLPALLAGGGIDTAIDPVALHHYLTFHAVVPSPRTLLAGVRKVPPATLVTIEADGRRRDTVYWQAVPPEGAPASELDRQGWVEEIERRLRVAVERRLVADVPVGVLLSGGLDSSLIVGMLAEAGQSGLQTFSIGFESLGGEEGNEFRWSNIVAERFGTEHHTIHVPTPDVLETLPGAIAAMSEPMVSHDLVAFYLLSQEVAKHVKVVQSGQGADEVFAGYHWYQPLSTATGDGVDDYVEVFFDRTHGAVAEAVAPEHLIDRDESRDFVTSWFGALPGSSVVERALHLDTHVMLVEDPVKRVDNTTMAWGLEARVPFLDHELVEAAFRCPSRLKTAQGGKGILKDVARRIIPHEVIDRPKGYFPVPPLVHLQGPYVEMLREALTNDAARSRGLFRAEHVAHLLDNPNELTTLRYNKLWELGLLELWLQTNGV